MELKKSSSLNSLNNTKNNNFIEYDRLEDYSLSDKHYYNKNRHILMNSINNSLKKSINEEEHNINTDWKPPKKYGLDNSDKIIESYYFKTNKKCGIIEIDYYDIIIDDIRNYRVLNDKQLKYIKHNLITTDKDNIIMEYNNSIKQLNKIIK